MKRDLNLVRDLLFTIEKLETPCELSQIEDSLEDYELDDLTYHLYILKDANYIDCEFTSYIDGSIDAAAIAMTWSGHEYLDAVRDATIWRKIYGAIAKSAGSVALETIKQAALELGKASLLSQLGL